MGVADSKPVLSSEDRDYISYHTSWSPSQIEKKYEEFIAKNPDGKILKEDFSPRLRSWNKIQNAEKLETVVFEAFDSNNDGYINFKEFMVVFYLLTDGTSEEKTKKVFRLCDKQDKTLFLLCNFLQLNPTI